MMMSSSLRKAGLTLHVACSVGWLGGVAACVALTITGLIGDDAELVRAAYIALALVTQVVVVPLSFAALLTGFVQAVGTSWGVLQHYWVIAKLLLTTGAVALLMLHTRPIVYMAKVAAASTLAHADFHALRIQLVFDAGGALVLLLLVTGLSVYKPRGVTCRVTFEIGANTAG